MKLFIADNITTTFSTILSHKAMLLISFTLTPIISLVTNLLQIEFLGFSLGILFFLTVLIVFDFITGIKAAKYNGKVLTSRKGLRTVDKLISYFMFICFTALLQTLLADKDYEIGIVLISNFKILVFILIFLWEFHSVGENLKKRYGSKPRMFMLLETITKLIEQKVIGKLDNGTIETPLNEKIEEIKEEVDIPLSDDKINIDEI